LSPSNKSGRTRVEYLDKRDELIKAPVNIVELDWLLRGARLPMAAPLAVADYYGYVSRADQRPNCDVYHWNVRQRFPIMPIPLGPGDADVAINPRTAFDMAYSRGRYEQRIDYSIEPHV